MSENSIEGESTTSRDSFDSPGLARNPVSTAAIRKRPPGRWYWTPMVRLSFVLLVAFAVALVVLLRPSISSYADPGVQVGALLPKTIPQPITRTTAGAQVAWLWVESPGQQTDLIAVDPTGRLAARLGPTDAGMAGVFEFWRSTNGTAIYAVGANQITSYSSLDGKVQQTYSRADGDIVGNAFSPDGRWLALLLFRDELRLQVIQLQTGASQLMPVVHDPSAALPGMRGPPSSVVWGLPVFAADSGQLYTLTDWGGPARLTAFSILGGTLSQTGAATDGQGGRKFPNCAGPAMAAKVVASGQTLVAFCHVDGAVWFFDLTTLDNGGVIRPRQPNPFWLSPIFTPDGQLLYLHQWPGFGDSMQVVDLTTRKLLGPVPTPSKIDQAGPFAWLNTTAYAGGVASTVPVSPDGLKLYSATADGLVVLRVPDLKPLANLAPGLKAQEIWVSGDGRTLYASADDGKSLVVIHDDGSEQKSVVLPGLAGGFIASEHG